MNKKAIMAKRITFNLASTIFADRRIGKWSEYRNSLTGKDLSEMYE